MLCVWILVRHKGHKGQTFGTFVRVSKQCLHIMKWLHGNIIVSQIFTRQILQSNILLFALWALFLVICKEIDFSLALTFCSRNKMLADSLHRMDCHLAKDTVLWIALSESLTPLISESLTKLISESLIDSLWKSTIKLSLSWLSSGLIPTAAAAGSCVSCCASCRATLCIKLCVVWSS